MVPGPAGKDVVLWEAFIPLSPLVLLGTLTCFKTQRKRQPQESGCNTSPFRQHFCSHLDMESDHSRKETERPSGRLCVVLSEGQVPFRSVEQILWLQRYGHPGAIKVTEGEELSSTASQNIFSL